MSQITPAQTERPNQAGPAGHDRTTRQAAIWATVVAVPLAALVAIVAINQFGPKTPAAAPTPSATSATAARPQSTAPVPMAAPPLSDRSGTVCRALLSKLPATIHDLAQRPVGAGSEQNAAYGEPALTVSCGMPAQAFPPEDDVWMVNSVCWHSVEKPDAPVVLTTVDREVPITVTVPRAYNPPLQWIAEISESVVAAVPSAKTAVPSGCTG